MLVKLSPEVARDLGLPQTHATVRACLFLGYGLLETKRITRDVSLHKGLFETADFLGLKDADYDITYPGRADGG